MIVRVSTMSVVDVLYRCFIERFALSWIQKYIPAFGGDPAKVTMCAH